MAIRPFIQLVADGQITHFSFPFSVPVTAAGNSSGAFVEVFNDAPDASVTSNPPLDDRNPVLPSMYTVSFDEPNESTSSGAIIFARPPENKHIITIIPKRTGETGISFSTETGLRISQLEENNQRLEKVLGAVIDVLDNSVLRHNVNEQTASISYDNRLGTLQNEGDTWQLSGGKVVKRAFSDLVAAVLNEAGAFSLDEVQASFENTTLAAAIAADPSGAYSGDIQRFGPGGTKLSPIHVEGTTARKWAYWANQWANSPTVVNDPDGNSGSSSFTWAQQARSHATGGVSPTDTLRTAATSSTSFSVMLQDYTKDPVSAWPDVSTSTFIVRNKNGEILPLPASYDSMGNPPSDIKYTVTDSGQKDSANNTIFQINFTFTAEDNVQVGDFFYIIRNIGFGGDGVLHTNTSNFSDPNGVAKVASRTLDNVSAVADAANVADKTLSNVTTFDTETATRIGRLVFVPGMIMAFAVEPPIGWLPLDGSAIPNGRTVWPELWAAAASSTSTDYIVRQNADGSTLNLRTISDFLRGQGGSTRGIGTYQAGGFPSHYQNITGTFPIINSNNGGWPNTTGVFSHYLGGGNLEVTVGSASGARIVSMNLDVSNGGTLNETRPNNFTVIYAIYGGLRGDG